MPPKGYTLRGASAAAAAGRKDTGATAAFRLTNDDDAASSRLHLQQLLQRREALERHLEKLDLRVYELETVYLRRFVELGGSLFDGFGLERQQLWCPAAGSRGGGGPPSAAGVGGEMGAYCARLYSFTPNDRVFTASSVGALGVVERLKTSEAAQAEVGRGKRPRARSNS